MLDQLLYERRLLHVAPVAHAVVVQRHHNRPAFRSLALVIEEEAGRRLRDGIGLFGPHLHERVKFSLHFRQTRIKLGHIAVHAALVGVDLRLRLGKAFLQDGNLVLCKRQGTVLRRLGVASIGAILGDFSAERQHRFQDGQSVSVAGVVSSVRTRPTKNKSLMSYVVLEDDSGAMELIVFQKVLDQAGRFLQENAVLFV